MSIVVYMVMIMLSFSVTFTLKPVFKNYANITVYVVARININVRHSTTNKPKHSDKHSDIHTTETQRHTINFIQWYLPIYVHVWPVEHAPNYPTRTRVIGVQQCLIGYSICH